MGNGQELFYYFRTSICPRTFQLQVRTMKEWRSSLIFLSLHISLLAPPPSTKLAYSSEWSIQISMCAKLRPGSEKKQVVTPWLIPSGISILATHCLERQGGGFLSSRDYLFPWVGSHMKIAFGPPKIKGNKNITWYHKLKYRMKRVQSFIPTVLANI